MISKLLQAAILPFVTLYTFRKYGGVWGLKRHLFESAKPSGLLLAAYERFLYRKGSWVGHTAQLDGEPCFPHGCYGVFISGGARIGKNVILFQQVTIGSNTLNDSSGAGVPVIGDNVYVGAGAKIIGAVTVGDNCRIGANAVVFSDLPAHSVAVQGETRVIQKEDLDNSFYSWRNGKWVYFQDGQWVEDPSKGG